MNDAVHNFSRRWINLALDRLGAKALRCSDDFFAPMERMLHSTAPLFVAGKYDEHGKWMDGWESRRKRIEGHDWCIVKLARPGMIYGLEIDTTHFTGNYPPAASVEACFCDEEEPPATTVWRELLARNELRGDHNHQYQITAAEIASHLRVNLFPDGGIARLRVFGTPHPDWDGMAACDLVDIAAALNGGVALYANDEHFGTASNLLLPGRGINMGDGWETRRRRKPGNDWAVIALAHPGTVKRVDIDTAYFKGNYPDRCSIQGVYNKDANADAAALIEQSGDWQTLLPPQKLEADREHEFEREIADVGEVTHVRLNIYPDGGVSRLRIFADVGGEPN